MGEALEFNYFFFVVFSLIHLEQLQVIAKIFFKIKFSSAKLSKIHILKTRGALVFFVEHSFLNNFLLFI